MEKYYYTISMTDGEKIKFEKEGDLLSQELMGSSKRFTQIEDRIININHIVSVKLESESERKRLKEEQDKKNQESFETIKNMRF